MKKVVLIAAAVVFTLFTFMLGYGAGADYEAQPGPTVTVTAEPEVVIEERVVEVPVEVVGEFPQICLDLVDLAREVNDDESDISGAAGLISLAAQDAQKYAALGWADKMVPEIQQIRDNKQLLDTAIVNRGISVHTLDVRLQMCEDALED